MARPFYRINRDLLHVQDQRASGVAAGTFTSGSWQKRTLNTILTNELGVTLVSDEVVGLKAGIYEVEARAPAYVVSYNQARLYDVTGAAVLVLGSVERASTSGAQVSQSVVRGRFTLAATSTVRLGRRGLRRPSDPLPGDVSLARQVFAPATPVLWLPGDEASGNLANRGSAGGTLTARGALAYRQASPVGYALGGSAGGYAGSATANVVLGDWSGDVGRAFGVHGGFSKYNQFTGSSWEPTTGVRAVNDGAWHLLSLSQDTAANTARLYVDGVADTVNAALGNNIAASSFCCVGAGYGNGTEAGAGDPFDGSYFGVAAWAAVLTAADWLRIYQAGIRGGVVV